MGSPPPMRGKVFLMRSQCDVWRITPAYAGKSPSGVHWRKKSQDHPRLCGEKLSASLRRRLSAGSPPPMRGKASSCFIVSRASRITPAYAGKR